MQRKLKKKYTKKLKITKKFYEDKIFKFIIEYETKLKDKEITVLQYCDKFKTKIIESLVNKSNKDTLK